jgi:hypothetical protein
MMANISPSTHRNECLRSHIFSRTTQMDNLTGAGAHDDCEILAGIADITAGRSGSGRPDRRDSAHASLSHMEDIAWVLRTDTKRNQVGFVRSKDLKIRERFVLDED